MKLIQSITTVGFYTVLSRVVGFFRDMLMAKYIGAGPVMDALSVAIKIPSFFRRLFAEGAFNAAFVPLFSHVLATEGREKARTYAEEVMAWLIMMILLVVVLFEVFMPFIMQYLAYGFQETPERMQAAINLTRITMPYLLVISLTALYSGILNSFDRFVAAASSPFAGNFFLVISMFLIRDELAQGSGIAWLILLSGAVQLVWVTWPAHKEKMSLRLMLPTLTPQVRTFFTKMVPGAIGSGVVQINLFLGTLIASFLPVGGISYLYYADRLNQLPLSVIGTAVSTALLPLMARQIKAGKKEAALHNQNRALEYAMLLILPSAVALCIAAEPFVRITFESGKFDHEKAIATARALQAFAFGLPAYILIKIFSTCFFARGNTSTPVIVASVCVVIDIVLSIALLETLAYVGIALATAVASWVNALCLGGLLRYQGFLWFDRKFKHFFPRCLLATACMGVIVFYVEQETASWVDLDIWWKLMDFAVLIGSGLISFFSIIFASKAVNLKEMWHKTME